jgi:hypothetical protein
VPENIKKSANFFTSQHSLFSRINYLLEMHQEDRDHYNKNNQNEYKCMTLITLITSFYLNLAQNDENRDLLLKLRLFEKLSNLMDPYSSSKAAKSFLAVANTKS